MRLRRGSKSVLAAMSLALAVIAGGLTGCEDDEIRTYRVPPVAVPSRADALGPRTPAARPVSAPAAPAPAAAGVTAYTVPPEWKADPTPRPMRRATWFAPAKESGGEAVEIALSTLAGDGGGVLANVNRWRGQLGLAPTTQAELEADAEHFTGQGVRATVVHLQGVVEPQDAPTAMLAAMILSMDGQAWFVKATARPEAIAVIREAFTAFVRSFRFEQDAHAGHDHTHEHDHAGHEHDHAGHEHDHAGHDHAHDHAGHDHPPASAVGSTAPPIPTEATGQDIRFGVPLGWEAQGSGPFVYAGFLAGSGDSQVKITVTPLNGDAGGALMNINRWRSQVQLPPIKELREQPIAKIQAGPRTGVVVDMAGEEGPYGATPQRLIVAMIQYEGATWFFKIMGPAPAVEAQKVNFAAFVESVRFTGDEP